MIEQSSYLAHLQKLHTAAWPTDVPREVDYPLGQVPLTDYLRHWAKTTPEKDAYIFYGSRISYAELDAQSDAFAALLLSGGLVAGDRVAVFMPNCPQFAIAFFGILKAGCVHVPVNPLFKEIELEYELNDTQSRWLVTFDQFMPLVEAVRARTSLEKVLLTSLHEALPAEPEIELPESLRLPVPQVATEPRFYAELAKAPKIALPQSLDYNAPAALNYTGGTTGMPKGCVHTQGDMVYTAASVRTTQGLRPDDIGLCFLPVFWIAGESLALLTPILTGASMVLMARWDPVGVMAAIERYKVSYISLLVDNAVEILDHPRATEFDLRSLRLTQVSSFVKKLNLDFRGRWHKLTGTTMIEAAWGMTETHTYDTFTRGLQEDDYDLKSQPVFVGLPMPGTEFKICDFSTGAILPLGTEGELCIRTPSLMKGYWNKPEATAESIRDGWFHTGDLANICEEGFVHFLGRRKEMLKVNGMSVFPAEIEALLGQHAQIRGSGVIGRPDTEKGQVPVAFIALNDGATLPPEELLAWCRRNMATYKVPEIRLIDQLPMTATGKVRKEELIALL